MKKIIFLLITLAVSVCAVSAQKQEVKDIVSKHLLAVVSPEQKTKITNLTAVGETTYVQVSNHQREYTGKSVLVSDGKKTALAIAFPLQDYQFERVTFDGRKATFPFIRPGVRSPLGNFLYTQDEVVKEGLFGGVLSTGWLLNYPDEKKGTLSVQGTKKLDGKDVQILSYTTKSGSGLGVKLFFDATTGRHIRTEYRRKTTQSMARSPEASAASSNDIIEELSEDFGDFKTEAGVTLPTSYKIRVAQAFGANLREFTYTMKIATFYYNQKLDAATFDAQAIN
jgi:hypothetical protein